MRRGGKKEEGEAGGEHVKNVRPDAPQGGENDMFLILSEKNSLGLLERKRGERRGPFFTLCKKVGVSLRKSPTRGAAL